MDGFTEKKWFVYLGDHHEGPFSLLEIQGKMSFGQLSATNYVWAEGMPDWTLMSDVQAFESVVKPPSSPQAEAIAAIETPTLEPTQVFSAGPALILSAANGHSNGSSNGHLHEEVEAVREETETPDLQQPKHKKALFGKFIKITFLFAILGGIGYAYNAGYLSPLLQSRTAQSAIETAMNAADPILSKLGISPIPKLEDVSPEEYAQLKAAALARLDQAGPQIAVALSKSDLLSPTFYVASNLPDGTILDIYLEGVPETLMNQLSFSAKTEAVITKKFGRTGPLQFSEGRAFPRGQYNLYVVDPGTQPPSATPLIARMPVVSEVSGNMPKGLRVLETQSYFLGGVRDAAYTARLKEFHDSIANKARQELTELQQIAGTLDSQLSETNRRFSSLKRGRKPSASQRRAWSQYHTKWTQLSQQLGELFTKLTPEAIEKDYFYGPLYLMSKQTSDTISQVHSVETSYFTGGAGGTWDPKAFGIQLGETQASAKSAVELLKAKIDQVSKLPPGPSGLPQSP